MLIHVCDTCNKKHTVEISGTNVIYMDGSKRVKLSSHDDDCSECNEEMEKEEVKLKAEARERVRARKQV